MLPQHMHSKKGFTPQEISSLWALGGSPFNVDLCWFSFSSYIPKKIIGGLKAYYIKCLRRLGGMCMQI